MHLFLIPGPEQKLTSETHLHGTPFERNRLLPFTVKYQQLNPDVEILAESSEVSHRDKKKQVHLRFFSLGYLISRPHTCTGWDLITNREPSLQQ